MNKNVAYYISELLYLHDCVIVPKFGGFVGNIKSATINRETGSINPPSKQILFNVNLKINDGLLISHIANEEGITQEIAKENVQIFSDEINDKLYTSKVLRLSNIGLFSIGKDNNIVFLQDNSINYSLDSFGMKGTYRKPTKRKIVAEKELKKSVQKIKITNQNSKLLLRAAAVMMPLIMLSYLSISQQEIINNAYTQMAILNPFVKSEMTEKNIDNNIKNSLEIKLNPVIIEEFKEIITTKRYYIIAGAFAKKDNAHKMLNKLTNWNYKAEIIEGDHLLRVSYNSFYNKKEALLALNKIKQENLDAWILTK